MLFQTFLLFHTFLETSKEILLFWNQCPQTNANIGLFWTRHNVDKSNTLLNLHKIKHKNKCVNVWCSASLMTSIKQSVTFSENNNSTFSAQMGRAWCILSNSRHASSVHGSLQDCGGGGSGVLSFSVLFTP